MSDLISRSALIEMIKGSEQLLDFQKDECIACINSCDTAYDIDKVVEELEKQAENTTIDFISGGYVAIDKAIGIVKQGGVSDDVCEWRIFDNSLTNEPQWVHETTCGKYVGEEHTSKAFVYCPYCGKKIKVVE